MICLQNDMKEFQSISQKNKEWKRVDDTLSTKFLITRVFMLICLKVLSKIFKFHVDKGKVIFLVCSRKNSFLMKGFDERFQREGLTGEDPSELRICRVLDDKGWPGT